METAIQQLESVMKRTPLVGFKLVPGREYFTGWDSLKLKYFGEVKSRYDAQHMIGFDSYVLVHRFILGKIEESEIVSIAQIDVLAKNIQLDQDKTIISNGETKYPMRIYLPIDTDDSARLAKFARYNSFLLEDLA